MVDSEDIYTKITINQHREANGPVSSQQPPHTTSFLATVTFIHPHKKKEEPFPIPLSCYRVIELLLSSFSTWFATFAVVSSASVTASVVALVVLSTCVSVNTCVRSKISLTVNLTVANPYFDT